MPSDLRRMGLTLACLLGFAALTTPALAAGSHERTQFGRDIVIEPNEQVSEATCFGCSIRVRGHVATDATAFGGSVIVEEGGQVDTDATVFGGSVRLAPNTKIGGDVTVFGGHVDRDRAVTIGGDVAVFTGGLWVFLIFGLPFVVLGGLVALIVWVVRRFTQPSVPATA